MKEKNNFNHTIQIYLYLISGSYEQAVESGVTKVNMQPSPDDATFDVKEDFVIFSSSLFKFIFGLSITQISYVTQC